ncbi:hypothetical protein JA1_004867 [Spathaspora sp. JA1]|nr:hypothetical protein JA1_004867 [Spathaspora sp. JA1]
MEKPLNDLPTAKNRYIKVLDLYFSNIIHNPILTSLAILLIFSYLQSKQWDWLTANSNSAVFIFVEDYKFDIISNVINLMFIVRFVYYIKLNLLGEIVLFLAQNFACFKFMLMKDGLNFLKDDDISFFLKGCMILQVLFPWLIFFFSLFQGIAWKRTLIDCNNNYLPLFMSQSFMFINATFPLLSDGFQKYELFYKLACFSLKFYLIFQFILYEFVLINYELEDVEDYSLYYRDVTCYNEKGKEITNNFNMVRKYALTVICLFIIIVDLGFIREVTREYI